MIEIEAKTHQAFEALREGSTTARGRACVDLAEKMYADGKSSEARQWISQGMKADAANTPALLRELKALAEKRGRSKKNIGAMRKSPLAVVSGTS